MIIGTAPHRSPPDPLSDCVVALNLVWQSNREPIHALAAWIGRRALRLWLFRGERKNGSAASSARINCSEQAITHEASSPAREQDDVLFCRPLPELLMRVVADYTPLSVTYHWHPSDAGHHGCAAPIRIGSTRAVIARRLLGSLLHSSIKFQSAQPPHLPSPPIPSADPYQEIDSC